MCTSTSRAGPSGRASTPRPGRPRPAESPPIVDMPLNSIPPTTTSLRCGSSGSAPARRRTSTWGSGAARCPATSPTRAAARRGRVRLQVFPGRLRGAGVPAARRRRVHGGDGRDRPARGAADRACRGRGRDQRRAAGPRRALRGVSALPPARGREPGGAEVIEAAGRDRRAGARAAPVQRRGAARCARRHARRGPTCRSKPARTTWRFDAEEVPDGATQFKCCPPIRDRQPGSALGRHWPPATSTAWSPTTPRAPRS